MLWMDAAWMASHDLFEQPLGAVVSGLPLLKSFEVESRRHPHRRLRQLSRRWRVISFTSGCRCPVSRALLGELGLKRTKANCMGRVLLNVPPASVYRFTRIEPARLAVRLSPMPSGPNMPDFVTMLAEAGPIRNSSGRRARRKILPIMPSYVVFVFLGMMAGVGRESELFVTTRAATARLHDQEQLCVGTD